MTKTIAFVIFPGFQLLDVAGPMAAFEIAGRYRPGSYALELLSPDGGMVEASCGMQSASAPLTSGPLDTLIVSGGDVARRPDAAARIVEWLKEVTARRITSVCSGAYLLAEAGLLHGRQATTHWANCDDFAHRYPKTRLSPERIYVQDGPIWTSAGITAGIDLALALIEADIGKDMALRTAQQLVVHHPRPGSQSQFTAFVELAGRNGRFGDLIGWMRERIAEPMTVERLADHVAMSPRHFARVFTAETGLTPSKAVERLRLEIARAAVETSHDKLDRIAENTGFDDPGRMRRAFLRAFGQPPQALRRAAADRIPRPPDDR